MSTARTADAAPQGLVQVGLASNGIESTSARWAYCRKDMNLMHVIGHCPYDPPELPDPAEGRSDPPVKPRSELAHQPGQQPAAP